MKGGREIGVRGMCREVVGTERVGKERGGNKKLDGNQEG